MRPLLLVHSIAAIMVAAGFAGCSEKQMRQDSSSMEPTIKRGEVIRVDTGAYSGSGPNRWDVVVFESPLGRGGHWASRVVGLPGESVEMRSGKLVIDGKVVVFPARLTIRGYALPKHGLGPSGTGPVAFPFNVPVGSYFVLGDNVSNALDSRYWGALDGSMILGKVPGK